MTESRDIRGLIQQAYGKLAQESAGASCCGPRKSVCCCGNPADNPVPEAELGLSCGDPVAFSRIQPGDVVLDLGSGGGKDVFLAALQTGPTGRAIGVDMTAEMLALAERNAERFRAATGLANCEFRRGTIEDLPVKDASVDLVISNCVINLSPDKPRVFREVFRALRPGGSMVVSDIVLNRALPPAAKESANLYVACVAGALLRDDYLAAIRAAGFPAAELLTDATYRFTEGCADPITGVAGKDLDGIASSITVVAVKPR